MEVAGCEVELLRKEYDILYYFMSRPNHMVDKATLAEAVWGDHIDQADNFGFRFRQPVGCLFCQMADFLHGMVGGVCDLAALVAILRLTVLRCLAQLLPKLLKGSIRAAAERCLRRGFEGFDGRLYQLMTTKMSERVEQAS